MLFRDGKNLTLAEVFASLSLTAYDLSIDTLDMHVSSCDAESVTEGYKLLTKLPHIGTHGLVSPL